MMNLVRRGFTGLRFNYEKKSGKVNITSGVIFFFQAEDGIRDRTVTGVQTCALPICPPAAARFAARGGARPPAGTAARSPRLERQPRLLRQAVRGPARRVRRRSRSRSLRPTPP